MLLQFVTVLQGVLAPALLVMALSVMLTVGEGRDKPLRANRTMTNTATSRITQHHRVG